MNSENKKHKILLSGGGTGGSVAPLLAIYDKLKDHGDLEFLWLGTKTGPERNMVERAGVKFRAIAGGKWRRYFSWKNFFDIAKIKIGFFQALFIMLKWRPKLVISAGSFISVPIVWAAFFWRVPVLIHQQDSRPGLANKLMAPLAKVITVTFKKSLADYGKKAIWTGNPVKSSLETVSVGGQFPGLSRNLPVVLVVGGGTGAMFINKLILESLDELTKVCQVIHVFGKEKGIRIGVTNYFAFEFLDEERIVAALKLADLVVTRAGLGFLSELSYLAKPAIIIPMPDSHQEENASLFKDAGLVLEQNNLTSEKLTQEIKVLLNNERRRQELGENMGRTMKKGANEAMVKIILELLK